MDLTDPDEKCEDEANAAVVQLVTPEVCVRTCGQICMVDAGEQASLMQLQSSVQRQIGMLGQQLQVFDVHGSQLTTDDELKRAIDRGNVPLQASLADAAIHTMEMKRDEIAQMQWGVVREQFAAIQGKISALVGDLKEVKEDLETAKAAKGFYDDRFRVEIEAKVEKERHDRREELHNVSNRLEQIAQAIHNEQSAREALALYQEKKHDASREFCEAERQTRHSELSEFKRGLEDVYEQIHQERTRREQNYAHCSAELKMVYMKCEDFTRSLRQESKDRELMSQQVLEAVTESSSDVEKQFLRTQTMMQVFKTDCSARIDSLEQQWTKHRDTVLQGLVQKDEDILDVIRRVDKLTVEMDQDAAERKTDKANLQMAVDKVDSLDKHCQQVEAIGQQMYDHERQLRADQLKTLSDMLASTQSQFQTLDRVMHQKIRDEVANRSARLSCLASQSEAKFELLADRIAENGINAEVGASLRSKPMERNLIRDVDSSNRQREDPSPSSFTASTPVSTVRSAGQSMTQTPTAEYASSQTGSMTTPSGNRSDLSGSLSFSKLSSVFARSASPPSARSSRSSLPPHMSQGMPVAPQSLTFRPPSNTSFPIVPMRSMSPPPRHGGAQLLVGSSAQPVYRP